MDNNNKFIRIKIEILNPNKKILKKELNKIILNFDKEKIFNYNDFIKEINNIYLNYGKIEKLYDKELYSYIISNKENIWNIFKYDEIIKVKLKYNNLNNINYKNFFK